VNNSSIKLFRDNNFLKRLDNSELKRLRADATESAYLKSTNSVNTSLKEIDSEMSELFLKPYFSSYKLIIRCKILDNGLIEKVITTTATLKNPNKITCNALDHFRLRVILEKPDSMENEKLRSLKKFQIIVDSNGNWSDCIADFKLSYEDYKEESSPYNIITAIEPKRKAYKLEFKESIQIKLTEKRVMNKTDNVFIHRVISPVENFHVNYSINNKDVDLIGNCFGTFQDTKDGGINIIKDKNSIDISTNKWLLNGNGIIIVHNKFQ